jgi:hypothetical protein
MIFTEGIHYTGEKRNSSRMLAELGTICSTMVKIKIIIIKEV